MKKKSKFVFRNRNLIKAKIKLRRNERFARKLIEDKYIALSLKNKELVEENASLLSQIEVLKNEKIDIFRKLIDLMPQQRHNTNNTISTELMPIMETMKSEHKKMEQLLAKSRACYNEMISKISTDIGRIIERNTNEDSLANDSIKDSNNNKTSVSKSAEQVYQIRRQSSYKRIDRLYHNNYTNLSVIEELSNERIISDTISDINISTTINNTINGTTNTINNTISSTTNTINNTTNNTTLKQNSTNTILNTPTRTSNKSSHSQYELTPNFQVDHFGTPSIFNFDCDSIINKSDQSSSLTPSTSSPFEASPQLTIHDLETTVTDEESNAISTSTPLYPLRKSTVNMNQRASKRISSITRPYSPLASRCSLKNIQNVFDNRTNGRKSSISKCDSKTKTSSIGNNSNDTNSMNTTQKKRKKCSTKSVNSDNSDLSDASNQSTSYSRRNRLPVSYKEPPLNRKIRRGDSEWSKN